MFINYGNRCVLLFFVFFLLTNYFEIKKERAVPSCPKFSLLKMRKQEEEEKRVFSLSLLELEMKNRK